MSIGQNIRQLRTKKGLTQKQLADQLYVTPQAVSRWENDEVEPNISILSTLSTIFGVDISELINGESSAANRAQDIKPKDSSAPPENDTEKENRSPKNEPRIPIARCHDCNRPIFDSDRMYKEENKSHTGHGPTKRTVTEIVTVCGSCHAKREEAAKREREAKIRAEKAAEAEHTKRAYGWSIAIGIITFAVFIGLAISNKNYVFAIAGIFAAYAAFALLYCIIQDTYISDLFVDMATFSIKLPGLIFTFDADGCAWFIAMKILFWAIGIAVGIGAVALAVAICAPLAFFSFPFYAKKGL